jgi:ubiquinone/menaquinone biosynthesis C-methylase UbiE
MRRLYERFFAHQLEKPSGLFGRLYMKPFLNRGNLRSNELALKHIQVGTLDSVLEIGFGGGWLLTELLKLPWKRVAGIDHSKAMVAAARSVLKDKAELHHAKAEELPFPSGTFSHVITVHTAYFWKNPTRVAQEIFRVLKPGGTAVLAIHSKAKLETQTLTQYNFTFYEPQALIALLRSAGFEDISLASSAPDEWEDNHCITARKSAS